MILNFLYVLQIYVVEITPGILLGFLLSGIIYEFLPQSWVNHYLQKRGILPLVYATACGIVLPLCCFGSLPVAMGLRKKGVSPGPILAFLVATPATSIPAILVTWRLLGTGFTLYLYISVILTALIVGIIGNFLHFKEVELQQDAYPMCEGENHKHRTMGIKERIIRAISFGFIDIPKKIGFELVIGLILAAIVASIPHIGLLIKNYLFAGFGYLFSLIFGLIMYICAAASVPLVHAFITQGLNIGAGLVLLIVGPVTSYGTILVVRKEFGNRVLVVYLGVICSASLILGYLFTKL